MAHVEVFGDFAKHLLKNYQDTSLEKLSALLEHLEEMHKYFLKEYAFFEVSWPLTITQHKRNIDKLKSKLMEKKEETSRKRAAGHEEHTYKPACLPDISLPTFKGDYADWPAFGDLFRGVISENSKLGGGGKTPLSAYIGGTTGSAHRQHSIKQ
ncbi:hypothetical protein KM043_017527 [Ampulex compressa]|nr:hypothetical protein KM043_017527 [Ampulex compressa]